ncbi:MAG: hypothetical protein Q8K66_05320 [Sediminibacterium sp.]|nr:hypothetical protein [Sediminibacterium sp.]
MKIKLCFSFLCLLLTILSFGQVTQEAINKSRDYINYKLTNYCIEKFVSSPDGQKNKIVYDSIKTNLTTKTLADASNYNTLSAQLSNRFDKVKIKLSENINKLAFSELSNKSLEESANIIISKTFDVYKTQYGTKFPIEDAAMKSNLEKEVTEFLKKAVPPVVPPTTPNVSPDIAANPTGNKIQNETKNNEKGFFSLSHLNFWNLLSLLLVIGVLIFCIFQISNIRDRIDRIKKIADDDTTPNRFLQHDSFSKNVNKSDVEEFIQKSDKISKLNDAISKLQHRISILEYSSAIPNQVIQKQQPTEIYTNADEVFYMMKPVDDYFPNSNKSYQKNDTVYKFTVKSNKTEALFEIHTGGAPVNDIAKRNEAYIKPACEEENMPGSPVNNIITKRKGVASLEGDKWIIKSKAVIRYE